MTTTPATTAARANAETRADALARYAERGLAAAHHETGIPKSTLRRWAIEEGLNPAEIAAEAGARTEAATEARRIQMADLRADVQEALLLAAHESLERLREPSVLFVGREGRREVVERPPADACRNFMVTAVMAIDKYRLEMGEATGRVETNDLPIEERIARVVEARERLQLVRDTAA